MEKRYTKTAARPTFGKIQFDSNAEYECFLAIKKYVSLTRIKVHEPVILRPANTWFPEQKWKVDFTITDVDELCGHELYIEYKGVIEDSFKEKLKSLAHCKPTIYSNLVIVTRDCRTIMRSLRSVTVPELVQALIEKDYVNLVKNCKKERNV